MKVQLRFKGFDTSESLAAFTTRKIHQHLSRFGHQVRGVVVRFSDVNGPRGGRDKHCHFNVSGPTIGSINLEGTHEDMYAAVDLTLERLAQTIGRGIERARERQATVAERRMS